MAKWTPRHEAPEPLEGPVVATVTGGTILWFVLFLAQLPFYGWFDDHGYLWWLWTCLAGGGLGFIGIWYVRRWEAALKRAATEAEAEAQTQADADADAVTETDIGADAGTDSSAATAKDRHVTP
ncbi:DUF2530 domain-containing protein [Streptomyces ureilyticus]|uniref:DUF2530 domain-containing protein n=1 Tax=Streptomyces ureilyticus TaxID=1775131 RepID=A0ABX0E5Z0_9ACTN|nr:DUF2530 domain-containing protein [Streptomyces ureilyticus]NGO48734.1 DUF2530 domain-containing protein [Streptomyces ureilyticus]